MKRGEFRTRVSQSTTDRTVEADTIVFGPRYCTDVIQQSGRQGCKYVHLPIPLAKSQTRTVRSAQPLQQSVTVLCCLDTWHATAMATHDTKHATTTSSLLAGTIFTVGTCSRSSSTCWGSQRPQFDQAISTTCHQGKCSVNR